MRKRTILFSGFMLFSLFFGAGNLIFPPVLGLEAGNSFLFAIAGFILTAVCLPILSIISISLSNNGLLSIGSRVHPIFGIVFAIIVYMSIGAFYGIPRASNVAYELGFMQIFSTEGSLALLLFSLIFFGLTYWISLNPTKIIDYVGKLLTPGLIIVLATLFIKAFTTFTYSDSLPTEKFETNPFLKGFLDGYFTLDAVAALAFGIVIINGLKDKGATTRKEQIKGTVWASLIAGVGLTIVYLSLSWIGRVVPHNAPLDNGAEILVLASQQLFGFGGNVLFGMIVILACLTTCVGLTNACASFFHELFPKLSYEAYVFIFIIVGLLFSNLGLAIILQIAEPLLFFIYPIAIVLVLLSLFQYIFGESKKMYIYSVAVALIFATHDLLASFKIEILSLDSIFQQLPLYSNDLEWMLPALVASIIGYAIDFKQKRIVKQGNIE